MAGYDFGLLEFESCFDILADYWYNNDVKFNMVNRGRRNNFKKIFFNQKFLSLVGLTVIILISFPLVKNAAKQHRINKEIGDFRKEIASLENKNIDLRNFISYLESDQFAEEQARLNLNLKKSGEELAVIKIGDNGQARASSSGGLTFAASGKEESPRELSNPRKWLNYFFK